MRPEPRQATIGLSQSPADAYRGSPMSSSSASEAPAKSARERFLAFRRSLPPAPKLAQRSVEARGLKFAVFASPDVPGTTPLVCVYGGLIYDHKLMWPALAPLAGQRQLILYDQRGRGFTSAPPGAKAARLEHDAGDLAALRVALEVDQWDVLGHSWGGGISMLGAAQDPEGVRKLVLVDSVGVTSEWLANLHTAALERLGGTRREALVRAAERGAMDGSTDDVGAHAAYSRAMYPAWFADRALTELFTPPRSESVTGAAIAARLRREGYDWRPALSALRAPTLVIHGEEDLIPTAVARQIASLLPQARLEIIAGAGHMPFWESPERFFDLVSSFLNASSNGKGHHEAT